MVDKESIYEAIAWVIVGTAFFAVILINIFLPIAVNDALQTPGVQGALDKVPKWQLQLIGYIGIGLITALIASGILVIIEKIKVKEN